MHADYATRPRFDSGYGKADKEPGKNTVKGIGAEGLWAMDPSKRPINIIGFFTGTLAGGEDEVIAIAAGARTSFKNRIADDRATIKGGLEVLKLAGVSPYTRVDVDKLKALALQSEKEDDKLIRAAGGTGTGGKAVRATADMIRRVVIDHHLARAAWGARGIFLLVNLKNMQVARGVLTTTGGIVASVAFPPLGIVSAAMAGHGAISAAVAKGIAAHLKRDYDEGLQEGIAQLAQDAARAPSTHGGHGGRGRRSNALQAHPAAGFMGFLGQTLGAIPPLGWAIIVTGTAGLGYLALRPASSSSPSSSKA